MLTSLLVMLVTGSLALYINLYATFEKPTSQSAALHIPHPRHSAIPTPALQEVQNANRVESVLPIPTDTPIVVTDPAQQPFSMQHEDKVRQTLLAQLTSISIFGFLMIAVLSGLMAYWLSGRALQPIQQVSDTVKGIRAGTLASRVNIDSPSTELKNLVQALDGMLSNLEQSFNQQGHFASLAAHELRTPLASLRTNVEVLYSDSHATVDDYRNIMPAVTDTLTRMDRLISDLLVMAKDEQSVTHQDIDLIPLLAEVLDDFSRLAAEHGITLELRHADDVAPIIKGEPTLLARLFGNLIENAIRYNHPQGKVTVLVEQHGSRVQVTVQDTGIGMTAQEQASIFAQFYRGSRSRQLNLGSTGLGLSLCAHIVRLYGGTISVHSSPDNGSRFLVQLPLHSDSTSPSFSQLNS
jgi:two-component system sensor histidine kinase ArlS